MILHMACGCGGNRLLKLDALNLDAANG
jgi:hypothetical protein